MRFMRPAAVIFVLGALSLLAAREAASQAPAVGESTVPGEIIIKFRPDQAPGLHLKIEPLTSHLRLFAGMDAVHYNRYLGTWRVKLPPGQQVDHTLSSLAGDPTIAVAQPNFRYSNTDAPGDPLYLTQQLPYYAAINATAGWETGYTGAGVVVAVIDGGVDIRHPELADHIWTNELDPVDGLDNDGNGCVDDTHGCSFVDGVADGQVNDLDGHGTFAAGIIAASRDNNEGIAGVASGATIMPVRALGIGEGQTEWLASAILYAARNGADVINMSLANREVGCPAESLVEDALREAHEVYGATLLAAAGNDNLSCVYFPASSQYTIAIAASGPPAQPDVRAPFSHYGPEIDVAAPGMSIVSTCPIPTQYPTGTCPGGPYGNGDGTSFSTPIVSGLAALILAQDPDLSNEDVRSRIRSTAFPLPDEQTPNWDGAGRIDMAAALGAGSGYALLDIRAPDTSLLDLSVVVGDPVSPQCRVPLWSKPELPGTGIQGSFGVGECVDYWPPRESRPWSLYGASDNRKIAALNGWSLRMGDAICAAPGSAQLPRQPAIISSNTCAGDGLVSNDLRAGAVPVRTADLPAAFHEELRYATSAGDPVPSCADASRGVWYRFEPAVQTDVVVDTFGSAFNTVLAVYRDSATGLEEVACNDDWNPSPQSRVFWSAEAGTGYYVLAAAYQIVPAGRLNVHFSAAAIPANDRRAGAAAISPSDSYPSVQPAHSATASADDPAFSCIQFYGFSLWYTISAAGGEHFTAETTGSDYDTVMAVFRDDGAGSLAEVACNDQEAPGVGTSVAGWDASQGRYFIVIGAYPGFVGSVLKLHVHTD